VLLVSDVMHQTCQPPVLWHRIRFVLPDNLHNQRLFRYRYCVLSVVTGRISAAHLYLPNHQPRVLVAFRYQFGRSFKRTAESFHRCKILSAVLFFPSPIQE
jgi:hypothetical protein